MTNQEKNVKGRSDVETTDQKSGTFRTFAIGTGTPEKVRVSYEEGDLAAGNLDSHSNLDRGTRWYGMPGHHRTLIKDRGGSFYTVNWCIQDPVGVEVEVITPQKAKAIALNLGNVNEKFKELIFSDFPELKSESIVPDHSSVQNEQAASGEKGDRPVFTIVVKGLSTKQKKDRKILWDRWVSIHPFQKNGKKATCFSVFWDLLTREVDIYERTTGHSLREGLDL